MVFGNNTASDISKLSKIPEPRSGEWYLENFEILRAGISAKYFVQVMLLFVYNRYQETFLFVVEKTNTGVYVRIISSIDVKRLTVLCEANANHSRQTTRNS